MKTAGGRLMLVVYVTLDIYRIHLCQEQWYKKKTLQYDSTQYIIYYNLHCTKVASVEAIAVVLYAKSS